ncbi:MAG: TonB-dependent receptor [Fluviicola sp.]
MKTLLLLLLLCPFVASSQINGKVVERGTNEPIFGAKVYSSQGGGAISDIDGVFTINTTQFPDTLITRASTYENDTTIVIAPGNIEIKLAKPQELKTVVVTSGRRGQDIENVPISMEILTPELIDNKGLANLEDAVAQSPGVYTMDGQVSIRGGSGFAYGAGSRVLLLWNGIPILSGDAGDAKWNAIPMECASQTEILKGASSVLYGSGALNGIISLQERLPSLKGETRVKVQSGVYGNPKRESLKWWSTNPWFHQAEIYRGKMFKNVGYTISANGFTTPGYREGEQEDRARLSGSFYFRPKNIPDLKAGLSTNFQYQKNANFIIWESDTFAYTPSGGADTSQAESTLSYQSGVRFSIDPYVKYRDKNRNLHSLKTRYYYINNNNITNPAQSSQSAVSYADYQFQRKWGKKSVLTSGFTGIRSDVSSGLFGDHFSNNVALYSQYEHKLDRLDLTGGLRLEYFEMDDIRGDSDFSIGNDSSGTSIPFYPIVRFGAHYQVAKFSHLRASFGQGIRYPSVAERYIATNVGALNVFANPNLTRETGWAAEIGFKQAVKIGEKWKGMIDVAGFVNQYNDMMEFTFGIFNPETGERLDPSAPDYNETVAEILDPSTGYTINDIFGFSAENAESARIMGAEISFNSQGTIGEVKLTSLVGYTYMIPETQNTDSAYVETFSTYEYDSETQTATYDPTLKYRFNHLFKADVEAEWKGISLGVSCRYNSFMKNIDAIFEDELVNGLYILPGLERYRDEFNRGNLVFDARIGYSFMEHYRLGFIVNNVLNEEYTTRPGDVQAPRNFILQLQMKF